MNKKNGSILFFNHQTFITYEEDHDTNYDRRKRKIVFLLSAT